MDNCLLIGSIVNVHQHVLQLINGIPIMPSAPAKLQVSYFVVSLQY